MNRKLRFAHFRRHFTCTALLAVMMGLLIYATPVVAGVGDRAVIVCLPGGFMNYKANNFVYAPTLSLGYEHDPAGGVGAELFVSEVTGNYQFEGRIYGANLSLIAPHAPHPLVRGRLIVGMAFYDQNNESADETVGWQAGVRLEVGRYVYAPLVMEVLYRWLDPSPRVDFSGPVFNIGFGFRFP